MRLKPIQAVVASGVFLIPALAQAQLNYSLFGNLATQVESVSATGSVTATGAPSPLTDKGARWRVSNVSSDLGIRASVDLGSGMTGMASLVTGLNTDGNSSSAGLWSTAKDVFVGVGFKDIGTVKLGRLTGAARWISGTADFSPAGAGPQDDQAALSGAAGLVAPKFNNRLDNAVGFESASWNGFSVRAYVGANEGKSNAAVSSGERLNDMAYSLGLRFVKDKLDLRAAYEIRNDVQTLNASTANKTKDRVVRLAARYTLPTQTEIAVAWDRQTYRDTTATGTARRSLEKSGWVIGAKHTMGKHSVYGGFGNSSNLSGQLANGAALDGSQTSMRQFVIAYNYAASKELLLEAYYSQLQNKNRAKYDFDSGGIGGIGSGATLKAIGVGLRYSF